MKKTLEVNPKRYAVIAVKKSQSINLIALIIQHVISVRMKEY